MPKRSLMLAGGGLKIAFQAGVLQVWLDEAGIEFHHADAVSAACFNLAMWTQGMSGTRIADNWRNLDPIAGVDVNFSALLRLIYAESLFELDAYRQKVFPKWGLDWDKIRGSSREATFNVYNFSKHELRPVTAPEMTEDFLVAAASLPMWLPPVRIDGDTYIDAVFNTASNLEEAIRRGSDELWVIWTTSQRGEWFDGFVGNFFGIFEATTNHGYKQMRARIDGNNAAIAKGQAGEFGRPITVRELKAEVPVHYLLNFSKDRAAEAVNRGVDAARVWCDANGISRRPGVSHERQAEHAGTALHFTERAKGQIRFAVDEPIETHLKFHISDVDAFLTRPEHEASLEGAVTCARLGGERRIEGGTLRLFVDQGDPTRKQVVYRMPLHDAEGKAYTLAGIKTLHPDSTGPTEILVTLSPEPDGTTIAKGLLRMGLLEFMEQLTSFRVEAATLAERTAILARFGAFYFGRLWDVYARGLLPSAPF